MTDKNFVSVKRMDIREFRSQGYLQEVNRLFFHRLGLALEVIVDEADGTERLGGVWDCRDDEEGLLYGDELMDCPEAVKREREIQDQMAEKDATRAIRYGFDIQPTGVPLRHNAKAESCPCAECRARRIFDKARDQHG